MRTTNRLPLCLCAKDKSLNAKFETNFDPTLTKVDVVPKEISRVILDLINNAFYTKSHIMKSFENG